MEDQNSLVLAYLGDAVYEIFIRQHLIEKNVGNVQMLQKEATHYVSARAQAQFLKHMIENSFLEEDEKEIVYRARNHKVKHKPKNTDIITYKYATGLEALIGWLYLKKEEDRIKTIMEYIEEMEK